MKVRRLLTLAVLAVAFACQDQKAPTDPSGVKPPSDPSMLISDGAHGGNPDFFFLPPLLPNPSSSPNYEVGRANTRLASALTVEICELQAAPVDAQGQPVVTDCIAGLPLKKFPAGTVKLADSGSDGFYMAQWKPSESNLVLSKYYRIKVLIEGSTGAPLGAADLDPVANQKELKNVRTGELIPLTADGTLPIKFRVEKGGGPPVCGLAVLCTSTVVTNNSPTGSTIVTVDGGSGAVAGAKFPNGWLPEDGPQSVVVTIASVNTGITNPATGTESIPCHAGVTLQQFRGCFNFTTTPTLDPINGESGPQFAIPVTVAVCYVLQGTGDPREKFAEMWASGPGETPHPLEDASDVGILSANTRDCSNSVIGLNNDKGITGLASAGWRKVKAGFGRVFGVQTAYAVDLGLGGFISEFSNVGPVLSAEIHSYTPTELTLGPGTTTTATARIVGNDHHATHELVTGLGGLAVTFTVAEGNGSLKALGSEGPPLSAVTVITNTNPIDGSPVSGGGFAPVNWTVPETPGTYTLTANGPAIDGPVTFTATVGNGIIAGGTLNDRELGVVATATIFNPIAFGGPIQVTGPANWNDGSPVFTGLFQPGGTPPNRSIWWNFIVPISGSYLGRSLDAEPVVQVPFSVNATRAITTPTVTSTSLPGPGQVLITWQSQADNKSCDVNVNILPYEGVILADSVVPCTLGSLGFSGLPFVAGSSYQISVFAFSQDVLNGDPIGNEFNVGVDDAEFVPTENGPPPINFRVGNFAAPVSRAPPPVPVSKP